MVPSAFIFLDGFPLTVNGSSTATRFPLPARSALISPLNMSRRKAIGKDPSPPCSRPRFAQDKVSVNDNFFDLGADSLMLTTLHRRLQTELKREFPITELFQFPTIRSFAERLSVNHEETGLGDKVQSRAQQQRAALARNRRPAPAQPLTR